MCERRKIMWFLLCALVQVASIVAAATVVTTALLLCALVQVASRRGRGNSCAYTALLLCALVQVASIISPIKEPSQNLLLCALVQVASNKHGELR